MLEQPQKYSTIKHVENMYIEKVPFEIECPLKFSTPECGTKCIGLGCAWFMPIQKACAVNVNARVLDTKRGY
jgi:hypothetical protein